MSQIAHYCQKCLAANPLGQDFCSRCGTRLMIIVEPASARFETGEVSPSSDEHLLERISSLENRLSRLTEKLERGLDLLLRQAQNSYFDRALVKALIGLLTEDGVVQSERLERLWNDRCEKDAAEQEELTRREELRVRILASYGGGENPDFERMVNDGFLLLEDRQIDRGIRSLQRAVESVPPNSVLLSFLGEHHFRAGRIKLAKSYLARAYEMSPDDAHLSLLLGLTCADAGDPDRAKELLSSTTRLGISSFAAHYGLGRLFAAEGDSSRALKEFKIALNTKPSPEAHYVIACLYYELNRDSQALRHLRKAIEMDQNYGEAFYLQGLIYRRGGDDELARQAFAAAGDGKDLQPNQRSEVQLQNRGAHIPDLSRPRSRRLVTGGDRRLAEALREEALKEFAALSRSHGTG
jgi:tetratricopeptide (TPR) repeat protein